MQVHPAFDITSRTWFVEGYAHEAPTLRELLNKFPKGTTFAGYTPDAHFMPPTRNRDETIAMMSKRIEPRTHAPATKRQFQAAQLRIRARALGEVGEVVPLTSGDVQRAARRSAPKQPSPRPTGKKGARYNSDAVLDLWEKGISSMVIAHRLGMARAENVRTIVQRARAKGDPRAVDHAPGRV